MSTDPTEELIDVPEGDRADQDQPAFPEDPGTYLAPPPDEVVEANEGDVADQSVVVPVEDDDEVG